GVTNTRLRRGPFGGLAGDDDGCAFPVGLGYKTSGTQQRCRDAGITITPRQPCRASRDLLLNPVGKAVRPLLSEKPSDGPVKQAARLGSGNPGGAGLSQ